MYLPSRKLFSIYIILISVGSEPERRPVICRQQVLIEWALANPVVPIPSPATVLSQPSQQTDSKNVKKRPEKALYVPKALRDKPTINETSQVIPAIKTWKDEIESQTGPVQLVQPLTDFLALETGCVTTRDKAFRRVVEMGDFPKGKA